MGTFKRFQYRGLELSRLLDLSHEQLMQLYTCRHRRKFNQHGVEPKCKALLQKLRDAKRRVAGPGEKPEIVKTHMRNMSILPEMIGSVVGVYSGKSYVVVEIKPE